MLDDNQIEILIAKLFSGEASPEEAMQLEDWASLSPSNRYYLNKCSTIFLMADDDDYIDNKHSVWKNIKDAVQKQNDLPKAATMNWRLPGVAASVVLILTIGLLMINIFKKGSDKIVYQTGPSFRKISLKDASEIIVSPNSFVTIDKEYGTGNRKIKLRGSAYFSVVHNPSSAFIIDMGFLYIKDLGTRFNVITSATGDTVFINVTEGAVSVYDDSGAAENAGAGEKVIYSKLQKKLSVFRVKQTQAVDTISKKKAHSFVPLADSPSENYLYPSQYPPDEGYTPKGKRALMYNDSIKTGRIISDMIKDGFISAGQPLSFKLTNHEFIINGKPKNEAIFQRYKKKYVPPLKESGEWEWSHNFTNPPVEH